MARGARRLVLILLLPASACMGWAPVRGPAPDVEERRMRSARVTLADGEVLLLREVVVRADSVVGHAELGRPMAFPREQVRQVEARRVGVLRTAAAAAGALLLTYALLMVYILSGLEW